MSPELSELLNAELCCGQVAGLINRVDSAARVMEAIIGEIGTRLNDLQGKLPD